MCLQLHSVSLVKVEIRVKHISLRNVKNSDFMCNTSCEDSIYVRQINITFAACVYLYLNVGTWYHMTRTKTKARVPIQRMVNKSLNKFTVFGAYLIQNILLVRNEHEYCFYFISIFGSSLPSEIYRRLLSTKQPTTKFIPRFHSYGFVKWIRFICA